MTRQSSTRAGETAVLAVLQLVDMGPEVLEANRGVAGDKDGVY